MHHVILRVLGDPHPDTRPRARGAPGGPLPRDLPGRMVVPVSEGQPDERHQDPISWLIDAIASVLFDVDEDVDEDGHDRTGTRLGPC